MKYFTSLLAIFFLLLTPHTLLSSQIEIDFYGLSYHLVGHGYADAPRKIDEKAAWVFNPGIGLSHDWRKNYEDEGVAPLVFGGMFQDCDDRSFYFAGGGGRYRKKLADDLIFDFDFSIIYSYAQNWWQSKYYGVWIPLANIGFSKPFWGRWWKYRITYAPQNTGITATSGGDLLFMNISMQL